MLQHAMCVAWVLGEIGPHPATLGRLAPALGFCRAWNFHSPTGFTALGLEPLAAFRGPLVATTSPLDFWSRRWNAIVNGLLRRTVAGPLARRLGLKEALQHRLDRLGKREEKGDARVVGARRLADDRADDAEIEQESTMLMALARNLRRELARPPPASFQFPRLRESLYSKP